jgi:soluble lytic murein transglycosylase-like protein
MTLSVKPIPAKPGQDALEKLKGPSSKDIHAEKARLRKATREFESFFIYQMLKTMRQTVPESALTKDAPMADGMGKETFTDIFDMEIARKTTLGGHNSIGDLLYNSMEKLIDAQFAQDSPRQTLKALQQPPRSPVKLNESGPIELPGRVQRFKPVRTQEMALPLQSSRRPVTEDPILIKYGRFIHDAARETKLDTAVIASVIRAESGGNPEAVSTVGAKGLMQLTDTTAQALQVENVFDPKENIKAGSRYLRQMLDRFGDLKLALAAYNAGPGNVVKYSGVPPFAETKDYLERVARFISEAAGGKL